MEYSTFSNERNELSDYTSGESMGIVNDLQMIVERPLLAA